MAEKRITQEVVIRPIRVGKTKFLSGKFFDKTLGKMIVITRRNEVLSGEQADKCPGSDIKNYTFNESVRQVVIPYSVTLVDGKIDETKMALADFNTMKVCEAWARCPQMQHAEAKDRADAQVMNPNLIDPWFSIEFAGKINIAKVLDMHERFMIYREFAALDTETKKICCFFMGYNPVSEGSVKVTEMMINMVDFNNGILHKSENRDRFLNQFLKYNESSRKTATINAAFDLNIVSYKVNAYYVGAQNVGINKENAIARIEKDDQMYEFIKQDLESKALNIEDDWIVDVAKPITSIPAEREKFNDATKTDVIEELTDVDALRVEFKRLKEAKYIDYIWHHMKPITPEIRAAITEAQAKEKADLVNA